MISKEKQAALSNRMTKVGISEDDLIEKFILGSGKGGQKVNTTSSCVYLKHVPTGLEVKCQKERSRELNRYYARRLLCEKLEEIILKEKSERKKALEKLRKQKKRRSRKHKAKLVEDKREHSKVKNFRKPPKMED
ncbi:MAG: peptide chain release factor-like protein [Rhabdochlamydiaceae bacterium]|nr:peptide chain release factor-like protein [Candidatus Amphrikana amoebophyrae]